MSILYIVRHGQSEGNIMGGFAGRVDYALSEKGKKQAELTAEFLSGVHLDAVLASPLTRAVDTAKPIAARHGLDLVFRPELVEFDFGDWEGLPLAELEQRFPDAVPTWKYRLPEVVCPHGESMADCYARAKRALAAITAEYAKKDICLVTHGALIKCMLCVLHGYPLSEIDRAIWANNASVTKVVCTGGQYTIEYEGYSDHMGDLVTGVSKALTEKK